LDFREEIMKSVLISIQPKWCELIANSKKTVEVRKSKPKLETPFKVYIYETKALYKPFGCRHLFEGKGKVIGEFVCDWICEWYPHHTTTLFGSKGGYFVLVDDLEASCLMYEELANYGNGKTMYGWHISDLVIYDKPRELSEFHKPELPTGLRYEDDAITRPPQSWCYVESEVQGK
jgi:predicted transcriptional regulator